MTLSHISCSYIIPYYIPSCQPVILKSNIIHILSIQIFVSHDCPTYNTLIYFSFRPAAVRHLLSYTPIKCPLYITLMPYTYCSPSYSYQIPDTYINHLLYTLILHIHIIPPYITLRPYYILFPAHPYKTPHTIHKSLPLIPYSYTVTIHPHHPHSIFIPLIHIPHNFPTYRTSGNCFISLLFVFSFNNARSAPVTISSPISFSAGGGQFLLSILSLPQAAVPSLT